VNDGSYQMAAGVGQDIQVWAREVLQL